MKRNAAGLFAAFIAVLSLQGVDAQPIPELENQARAEGAVVSLGMPDAWANWGGTWRQLEQRYGLHHTDSDMTSAEEIAKFEAEKSNATADIGDVGFEFANIAKRRGITRAYKPATWAQIPAWAKDDDGHWAIAYTGTIAFAVNTRKVSEPPASWKALAKGNYRIAIGEVGRASQANAALLAAAVALGGDESNLRAALEMFSAIARDGRLLLTNPSPAMMERSEADVFLVWDFNALSYRDAIPNHGDYVVRIPSDGSITSGYSTIINRYAPHPRAADLTREFIFSDEGQLNLARGNARPIRIDHLKLPDEIAKKLIESSQYRAARPVKPELWETTVKQIPKLWQAATQSNAK